MDIHIYKEREGRVVFAPFKPKTLEMKRLCSAIRRSHFNGINQTIRLSAVRAAIEGAAFCYLCCREYRIDFTRVGPKPVAPLIFSPADAKSIEAIEAPFAYRETEIEVLGTRLMVWSRWV
jgi:hypothetical protein